MKRILLYFSLLFVFLTLMSSGCDCDGRYVDNEISFSLEFDSTNNSRYSTDDIDTITIFKLRKGSTEKLDTLIFSPWPYGFDLSYLFKDTVDYTNSDYIILIKDSSYFHIKDFEIESIVKNETCGEANTKKTVTVNDLFFDLTTNDARASSLIVLKKSMSLRAQ